MDLMDPRHPFLGTKPSELFLEAWDDIRRTWKTDDKTSGCLPLLVGTTGYSPYAIVGSLWDIVRHMSNMIVRAEKEVLLATNYWKASGASRFITDALIELSRRAGERKVKVPVRIMYDRANMKHIFTNHQLQPESVFSGDAIQLPTRAEVPWLDMEVVNFHRPFLGTFHPKFLVVDGRTALMQSNNIQVWDSHR